LALKEPHEQLQMLQNLIEMFQKNGVLEKLMAIYQVDDYLRILQQYGLQ
ncbi:PTS sugar transporter subunit IIA, partial [Acinetobacter soli]|nr:PTS sugar transporter subunit IIA [Acinetobacter soli]